MLDRDSDIIDTLSTSVLVVPASSRRVLPLPGSIEPIVLASNMATSFDLARRAAVTPLSVLIQGETGVGKELIAHTVHRHSDCSRPWSH